jgi:hypothetical protein
MERVPDMKRICVVLLVAIMGCSRSPSLQTAVGRPGVPRVLEISAVYHFPPGALRGFTLREADGRLAAYAVDLMDTTKHFPLDSDPRLVRFIDRVDSLITYRLPSDTNRALPPGERFICGDGFSFGARLTIGSTVRPVGSASCNDRSPGSGGRTRVLEGITDSLFRAMQRQ